MDKIAILDRVIKRIEDPKHWCQGSAFKDAYGVPTSSHTAVSCCLHGAIQLSMQGEEPMDFCGMLRPMLGRAISTFNDHNDHTTVLNKLKEIRNQWSAWKASNPG